MDTIASAWYNSYKGENSLMVSNFTHSHTPNLEMLLIKKECNQFHWSIEALLTLRISVFVAHYASHCQDILGPDQIHFRF